MVGVNLSPHRRSRSRLVTTGTSTLNRPMTLPDVSDGGLSGSVVICERSVPALPCPSSRVAAVSSSSTYVLYAGADVTSTLPEVVTLLDGSLMRTQGLV